MPKKYWTADVSGLSKTQVKEKLWDELRLKADVGSEGITISQKALDSFDESNPRRGKSLGGGRNRKLHKGKDLPGCVYPKIFI